MSHFIIIYIVYIILLDCIYLCIVVAVKGRADFNLIYIIYTGVYKFPPEI